MADIGHEELQYEETVDLEPKDKGDDSLANGHEESIESELEAIKGKNNSHYI